MDINDDLKRVLNKTKFIKKKKQKTPKHVLDKRVAEWQMFYLNNLDVFVEDFLQIPLKHFQALLLLQASDFDCEQTDIVASRGATKTAIISLLSTSLALLLPNINILIVSMTLHQSNLIIKEKIDEMYSSPKSTKFNSPTLQKLREEGYISFVKDKNTGGLVVEFGNNSKIFAVNCGDSARGK